MANHLSFSFMEQYIFPELFISNKLLFEVKWDWGYNVKEKALLHIAHHLWKAATHPPRDFVNMPWVCTLAPCSWNRRGGPRGPSRKEQRGRGGSTGVGGANSREEKRGAHKDREDASQHRAPAASLARVRFTRLHLKQLMHCVLKFTVVLPPFLQGFMQT